MKLLRSIVMYGAPVWCDALVASSRNIKLLHRQQRKMAVKIVRVYSTIPWEAACVLTSST